MTLHRDTACHFPTISIAARMIFPSGKPRLRKIDAAIVEKTHLGSKSLDSVAGARPSVLHGEKKWSPDRRTAVLY